MKITTEFVVLHEDQKMPKEEKFCTSFWEADDSDSDGDYYYDNIDGRWTSLSVTKRESDGKESSLSMSVCWEFDRLYEPSVLEVEDLKRFIDYKHRGRYANNEAVSGIERLGVTSFSFETHSLVDYYLGRSKGYCFLFKERFNQFFVSLNAF